MRYYGSRSRLPQSKLDEGGRCFRKLGDADEKTFSSSYSSRRYWNGQQRAALCALVS